MWNFLYSALIFTFCWADERGIKGPWQGEWGFIPPGVKCWYISNLGKTEVGGTAVGESEAGHLERVTGLTVWRTSEAKCLWNVQEGRRAWLWWKEGGRAQDTPEVYGGLVLRIPVYKTVLDAWRADTPCIIQQICSQSFPSLLNPTQVLI